MENLIETLKAHSLFTTAGAGKKLEKWSDMIECLPETITAAQAEAIRRAGAPRRHKARVEAAKEDIEKLYYRFRINPAHRRCRVDHHDMENLDLCAVRYFIRQALESALDAIGKPGSASGSSAPGIWRNSPGIGALVSACRTAIDEVLMAYPAPTAQQMKEADLGIWRGTDCPGHFVSAEQTDRGIVLQVFRDDEDTTLIASASLGDPPGHSSSPPRFQVLPAFEQFFPVFAEHFLACGVAGRAEAVDRWIVHGCTGEMPPLPDADACEIHAALVAARQGAEVRCTTTANTAT